MGLIGMLNKRMQASKAKPADRPDIHDKPMQFCATGETQIKAARKVAEGEKPPLREFSMNAYTGGEMVLPDFRHPVVVELSGIRASAKARPALRDHDYSKVVGHSETVEVDSSGVHVEGLVSGTGQAAREVVADADNGFPWQVSIGAIAHQGALIPRGRNFVANGRTFVGPKYHVTDTTLSEFTFTPLGADDDTTARIAANKLKGIAMTFEQWLEAKGFKLGDLDESQEKSLRGIYDAEQSASSAEGQGSEGEVNAAGTPSGDAAGSKVAASKPMQGSSVTAGIRAEALAEETRLAEIKAIAGGDTDLHIKAIAEGWDNTQTELAKLRKSRGSGPAIHSVDPEFSGRAIEASLCLSSGLNEEFVGKGFNDKEMEAALSRELRGIGLHFLMHQAIQAAGQHYPAGRVDDDFIRAALDADQRIRAAGGGFSTVSVSGILSNVANKSLLNSFKQVPSVIPMIAAQADHSNFLQHTKYRMTGIGIFETVGPGGELQQMELSDETFSNTVGTKGRMLTLTRTQMINDDMGAFLAIPKLMGRGGALALQQAFYTLLLDNSDNFFHADNRNLITGAGSALGIQALTDAEQLFLDQQDDDSNPVLVSPAVLLSPTSLKSEGKVLMSSQEILATPSGTSRIAVNNPHSGSFEPASTPYLNSAGIANSSATAWYLFGNPQDIAAMEVAYLRGLRTPTIEAADLTGDRLGQNFRGYWDFGVAKQDHRGAVKSNGA